MFYDPLHDLVLEFAAGPVLQDCESPFLKCQDLGEEEPPEGGGGRFDVERPLTSLVATDKVFPFPATVS